MCMYFGKRNIPFFFGIGLAIILVIVVLYLIFHHGPAPKPTTPMAAYANNPTAQVAMLIDGPVNAPSLHNQVQVVINNYSTTINVFQGYNDKVVASKVYANDVASFHVFLRSLEYAGFERGRNNPHLSQASGYCPTGDRYIFSFDVNNTQKERRWIDTCNGDPHTFYGDLNLTLTLFQNQVPDYSSLTSGLNI